MRVHSSSSEWVRFLRDYTRKLKFSLTSKSPSKSISTGVSVPMSCRETSSVVASIRDRDTTLPILLLAVKQS